MLVFKTVNVAVNQRAYDCSPLDDKSDVAEMLNNNNTVIAEDIVSGDNIDHETFDNMLLKHRVHQRISTNNSKCIESF